MESTRPACIPPSVGFHVMKILCRVEGEADLMMRICSTHINKRALHWQMHMLDSHSETAVHRKIIASTGLWKLLEDIFQISEKMACTP